MTINQLRYFVSAAEYRSFTKAAERHFISQTAITQQIQALEDLVGTPLFDRSRRPIHLTSAGKVFLNEAKAILERVNLAVSKAAEASSGVTGTLQVGYVNGYERSNLSTFMQRYHREHPNVLITYYRLTSDRLASGLVHNELDIIFTWDSTNLRAADRFRAVEIERARLMVAVCSSHPFAQRSSLSRADLAGEKNIYVSPSADFESAGDAYFLNLYRQSGYTPDIVFRTTDIESALMMVASEEGISVLPEFSTRKLDNADNLTFIPLTGENEVEVIHGIVKKDNANPALLPLLELFG